MDACDVWACDVVVTQVAHTRSCPWPSSPIISLETQQADQPNDPFNFDWMCAWIRIKGSALNMTHLTLFSLCANQGVGSCTKKEEEEMENLATH